MKKFNIFMALVALVTISLVACEKHNEPEPTPTPEVTDFEVTISNVTRGSVTFGVTPVDKEMDYLCAVYEKEVVEEYLRDEFFIEVVLQELGDDAASKGKTLNEYMAEVVDRGDISDATISGLAGDSDYYIVVFGVDAAQNYKAITPITKVAFRTEELPFVECDFNVRTSVAFNNVTFTVKPSDTTIYWYLCTLPTEQYEYYTEEQGMSREAFYRYYFQQEINSLLQAGYSESQVIGALIHGGELQLEAQGLKGNTEYCYLIAGLILDDEGIVICTDVQMDTYVTGDVAPADLSFVIDVWDVDQMSASIRITPSNNNDVFCALIQPWDGVSTADEVMHRLVNHWGNWMDVMANDKGVVEYAGDKAFKLPAADTDYYVIAFGYDGGITTDAYMKTFRTLPGGSVEEVEFTVTASSVSPYGFTMNITSSDPTIYYIPGACIKENYNEELFIKGENEAFDYYYEGSVEFNPSYTVAEVLDQYYYNGNSVVQVSGLQPDTEIMAYVYALDIHTGHVVKCFTFDAIARTSTLGVAAPEVELVGYYSGDDENGTIWNDASVTRGKAITVVKYTNLDDVRTLYTTMVEGDCTNLNEYPDPKVWTLTSGYWKTCKVAEPYTFYLADWNLVQTALAYATDNNGKVGIISRLYTKPTAENKSNIEELRELTESLNNSSKKSIYMPESVVFGDEIVPTRATITAVEL
jgi:hypothetical protein